ncbi:MAG: glycosyltransferase family 39 protein [Deltaproteobacteria bacterium]|nr:glycosyltransferase family 39 protein [Deltaproteobacteria bacterium]MCB9487453.1 glycosyltransferase family 39 protein [Deltaproteobacteria bacterium]
MGARSGAERLDPAVRLALGMGALSLVRLALIGRTDLIPDEAYYFQWARDLAACYWDQPGGIALFHRINSAIFGATTFGVRVGAVWLSLVTTLFAYDLGKTCLGDRNRASWAALAMHTVPLLSVGAVLILHDTLLGALATAMLAFFARAVLREQRWAWYAMALAGAAALYAKFSAVTLVPGMVVFMLLDERGRRAFRQPEPYLAGVIVAVLFTPVIAWNAKNGWVAYYAVAKLAGGGDDPNVFQSVAYQGDFIASQLLLASPILFYGILRAVYFAFRPQPPSAQWSCGRRGRSPEPYERTPGRLLLACVTASVLGYFLYQATNAKVQGNWAAMAYVPGMFLVVDFWAQAWDRRRKRATWALGLAAAMTILIQAHTARPFLPLPAKADMTAQAHGWRDLAARVEEELAKAGPNAAVMGRRYQVCSELDFYLPDDVEVYCAAYASRGSQYDIWENYEDLVGRDVIYVNPQGHSAKLSLHFADEAELGEFVVGSPGRPYQKLQLLRLERFKLDGPLQSYFNKPFPAARGRLVHRVQTGKGEE